MGTGGGGLVGKRPGLYGTRVLGREAPWEGAGEGVWRGREEVEAGKDDTGGYPLPTADSIHISVCSLHIANPTLITWLSFVTTYIPLKV